jgi:hypothetical protein
MQQSLGVCGCIMCIMNAQIDLFSLIDCEIIWLGYPTK